MAATYSNWIQYTTNNTSATSANYTIYPQYYNDVTLYTQNNIPGPKEPLKVQVVEVKELTALEWLDEQVAEICELAYAA